jgi:hypothetical protein
VLFCTAAGLTFGGAWVSVNLLANKNSNAKNKENQAQEKPPKPGPAPQEIVEMELVNRVKAGMKECGCKRTKGIVLKNPKGEGHIVLLGYAAYSAKGTTIQALNKLARIAAFAFPLAPDADAVRLTELAQHWLTTDGWDGVNWNPTGGEVHEILVPLGYLMHVDRNDGDVWRKGKDRFAFRVRGEGNGMFQRQIGLLSRRSNGKEQWRTTNVRVVNGILIVQPMGGRWEVVDLWSALPKEESEVDRVNPYGIDIHNVLVSQGFRCNGMSWEKGDVFVKCATAGSGDGMLYHELTSLTMSRKGQVEWTTSHLQLNGTKLERRKSDNKWETVNLNATWERNSLRSPIHEGFAWGIRLRDAGEAFGQIVTVNDQWVTIQLDEHDPQSPRDSLNLHFSRHLGNTLQRMTVVYRPEIFANGSGYWGVLMEALAKRYGSWDHKPSEFDNVQLGVKHSDQKSTIERPDLLVTFSYEKSDWYRDKRVHESIKLEFAARQGMWNHSAIQWELEDKKNQTRSQSVAKQANQKTRQQAKELNLDTASLHMQMRQLSRLETIRSKLTASLLSRAILKVEHGKDRDAIRIMLNDEWNQLDEKTRTSLIDIFVTYWREVCNPYRASVEVVNRRGKVLGGYTASPTARVWLAK